MIIRGNYGSFLATCPGCRAAILCHGLVWGIVVALLPAAVRGQQQGELSIARPVPLLDGIEVELIAREPEIVTPIGCRFDLQGRLFVIESHTHFPPDQYAGPPHDRIKVWRDSDGDGRLDAMQLFHEGTRRTMGLAIDADGWVYLITRQELLRVRDTDGDLVADTQQSLVRLDTTADYPHNGLGGIALKSDGRIVFGLGENFGAPYVLRGSDGSELRGGGEGGNVFSCTRSGGDLRWIATGFWNPFGIATDPHGRILVAGNDPDAAPPNRIVHVVPGGDYGFQFRFGRSGIHPLQAWNGELPGTLPRVSAAGEAACAVLPFRNRLWVTSWGDNRIEMHRVASRGATIAAEPEVVVTGSAEFRPVDMAVAPDGSLYVTDWVDRSYPVHGRGRIWRLRFRGDPPPGALPPLSNAEVLAARLRRGDGSAAEYDRAVHSDDPFLRQAAVHAAALGGHERDASAGTSAERLTQLLAARWRTLVGARPLATAERDAMLTAALRDSSTELRLAAVRWIAEQRLRSFETAVRRLLEEPSMDAALVGPAVACLAYLETGEAENKPVGGVAGMRLAQLLARREASPAARLAALRLLPVDAPAWQDNEQWQSLLADPNPSIVRETIRHAAQIEDSARVKRLLQPLIGQADRSLQLRFDALWVLALRTAGPIDSPAAALAAAERVLARQPEHARLTDLKAALASYQQRPTVELPADDQLERWLSLVEGAGDAAHGWRIFQAVGCADCHAVAGRGSRVGPELTNIGQTQSRGQLLQSIVEPSRDIGPLYGAWQILTTDGRTLRGIKLNGGGVNERYRYLAEDGSEFSLAFDEIEVQRPADVSLMPSGLHRRLQPRELRDLLQFLEASR